jgi:uncharacterized protein YcfJ
MKTPSGFTLLILLLGTNAADVAAGHGHYDRWAGRHGGYARVLRVRPIYETVEEVVPETQCNDGYLAEVTSDPDQAALTGAVTGGIVGGVAGDQLGQGTQRTVMTVAGSVIGAAIGYKAGPSVAQWYPASEWLPGGCDTVERIETRDELVGYRVKYRYRGHVYHARTIDHPGDRIRVDRRARPYRF